MSAVNLESSRSYDAISDDQLKDEDNAIWVVDLSEEVRHTWLQRIYWLRWVDRLAEQEQIVRQGNAFQEFQQAWKRLLESGQVHPHDHQWIILDYLHQVWFSPERSAIIAEAIEAWDGYVDAMGDYHQRDLTLETLADYELMLERIAGSFFQCFPYQNVSQLQATRFFGLVDQFYNNLRDLHEDTLQQVCYFPAEVLDRFNLHRQEILEMTCFKNPGYFKLMEFWIEDYLPTIRRKTARLVLASDLHPSWRLLGNWCIHRYGRVERVMKSCSYNFVEFPTQYWKEVRRDLAHYHTLTQSGQISSVQRAYQVSAISRFLKLSPATVNTIQTGFKALEQNWDSISSR
ncbi:MAG: squalene/phytoene synthase family protein [Cyanobacteria bacterium P01_A01_bin.123]